MQAFCETPELASIIVEASTDRRMDKAHVKVHMGGAPAAIEAYRTAPTPNLILLEARHDRAKLHRRARRARANSATPAPRSSSSDATNDIALYRELMSRGISEYLVDAVRRSGFRRARFRNLYTGAGVRRRSAASIAFVGAKGGVGASTIAHNVAWSIARDLAGSDRHHRHGSGLRHGRPRFQPGPAAGHRRRGVRARPRRREHDRPVAVEMHAIISACSPRPRRSTESTISTRPRST